MNARLIVIPVAAAGLCYVAYLLGAAGARDSAAAAAEEKYRLRALEEVRLTEEAKMYAAMRAGDPSVSAFLECGTLLGVDMQDLSDALRDEWEQEQLELQSEEAARPDPR